MITPVQEPRGAQGLEALLPGLEALLEPLWLNLAQGRFSLAD